MIRVLLCLAFIPCLSTQTNAGWKAGTARVNITPKEPLWMAGYAARTEPAQGKETDLFAKATAFEDAKGARLVVVSLDLIGVPRSWAQEVSSYCESRYGLARHQLLLNASHTHCGPAIRIAQAELRRMPEEQRPKVAAYVRLLRQRVVRLVGRALEELKPATLEVSQASAGFAKNRRFPTDQGFVNRQYDSGVTDQDVPVLSVKNASGELVAVLFGYACHNTTLGFQKWCGDYAGFAQKYVQQKHPGVNALFITGAGGDQNPYPRRTLELCKQHGRALAESVERALASPQTTVDSDLSSAFEEVVLEFKPLPAMDQIRGQLTSSNKYVRRKAEFLLGQLETEGAIDLTYPCPVQAIRFGNELLMVGIGGEVVVDYSRRIKREYAGPLVWVAGYSNDVFGYLPSERVLNEGGYEGGGAMLYGPLPGPFEAGVEQRVMDAVDRVVQAAKAKSQ